MISIISDNQYDFRRESTYAKVLGNDCVVKRLTLDKNLKVHQGCVNSIVWNSTGEYILSGSDDLKLVITNPFNSRVAIRVPSGHKRNVFQARFLPESGNRRLVSCAVDGSVSYTQLEHPDLYGKCMFYCHKKTAYQVQTTPGDPNTFLSSSEDGTIRWYDTRIQESCVEEDCRKNILLDCKSGVNSMDIDPVRSYYLAAGSNDAMIRIFDRRMMKGYNNDVSRTAVRQFCIPSPANTTGPRLSSHTTYLKYDKYGAKLLANTTPRHILEIDCWTDKIERFEAPPVVEAPPPSSVAPEPRNMRVRLRGDWSDTGPSAAPSTEANDERELSRSEQIFRDMSSALTSVLRARSDAVSSMQEDGDVEHDSDNEEEDTMADKSHSEEDDSTNASCPHMFMTNTYFGHRNQRTAIKQCSYWGDNLVVAGSDCGHIFLWRRDTGKLINVIEGDKRVVNCVQPHQYYPVLATSGIDYDIKLWTPHLPHTNDDEKTDYISKVLERNKKMLEDSDDVVTLPARFILPLLALLARRRASDAADADVGEADDESDD